MRTRFSVSARCAFSCASCECRCAYCRVLFEVDDREEEELVVVVEMEVEVGLEVAKEDGLAVVCL